MAILSIKEISDGREGSVEVTSRGTVKRYTRTFRAKTDDNSNEASLVLAVSPTVGVVYPYDSTATLRVVRAAQMSSSKRWWIVTAQYDSEKERREDPQAEPCRITWSMEQFQRVFTQDRDGYGIVNSAGDPFDPPVEGDESRWSIRVQKNCVFIPTWVLSYADTVNSDSITIDGVSFPANSLKVQGIEIGEQQWRNDIPYRSLTMTFHYQYGGWQKKIQDAGLRQIDLDDSSKRVKIHDSEGVAVDSPVLLNGAGSELSNPSTTNAVYLTYDIYPSAAYSALAGIFA